MDDLASFELLSLVSKVTSELQNHLGINDKTLAEFVIAQHSKCQSLSDFRSQMESMGAEFPSSLVESVDRLILTMHTKYKGKADGRDTVKFTEGEVNLNDVDKKTRIFKGLAVPDREQQWEDEPLESGAKDSALDDTFAMLEGMAGKAKAVQNGAIGRKRSRSPDDVDGERSRQSKDRRRSRSRSGSRDRNGRSSNGHRAKGQGSRHEHESSKRRHRHVEDDYFKRPPTPEVDDAPKMFKIYNGRISGVKPFGAFVDLQGVKGRASGLVHVSAMLEGERVNDPSDLVSVGTPDRSVNERGRSGDGS